MARPERKVWTLAEAVRVLDNPRSTPEDVHAARRWNAITPTSAENWLRGWNAGVRSNGGPPAMIDRVA